MHTGIHKYYMSSLEFIGLHPQLCKELIETRFPAFDVDVVIKEPDWSQLKKRQQLLDRLSSRPEWIPAVQLEVNVDVQTQIRLNVTTDHIQEVLERHRSYA